MSGMYVDAGSEFLKPPFGVQNFGLLLEAGQLVLFPSSVLHHVLPFQGEGERITVAFNCAFWAACGLTCDCALHSGWSAQPTIACR